MAVSALNRPGRARAAWGMAIASKLPVVVYVPDGFEVRYRVWTAGEMGSAARE